MEACAACVMTLWSNLWWLAVGTPSAGSAFLPILTWTCNTKGSCSYAEASATLPLLPAEPTCHLSVWDRLMVLLQLLTSF